MKTVLLAEDDEAIREGYKLALEASGYHVLEAGTGRSAAEILLKETIDLIVTDLKMPDGGGLELAELAYGSFPGLPVILMTSHPSVDSAVSGFKTGIVDYLIKPFTDEALLKAVGKAFSSLVIMDKMETLRSIPPVDSRFPDIIGHSPGMIRLMADIHRATSLDVNILINGETGSGKNLVARTIHQSSLRSTGPFVMLNCAAVPQKFFEAELFGAEEGALAGKSPFKAGCLEKADKGTLCLDGVGELSRSMQSRLLVFLKEHQAIRLGGSEPYTADVRVISVNRRDLMKILKAGRFREDLFYQLAAIEINVPPLRERLEDIPRLAVHFLDLERKTQKVKKVIGFTERALENLKQYLWPGNVREFANAIQAITAFSSSPVITEKDIANCSAIKFQRESPQQIFPSRKEAVVKFERDFIKRMLKKHDDNVTHTAKALGIHRTTLQRLFKKLKITAK